MSERTENIVALLVTTVLIAALVFAWHAVTQPRTPATAERFPHSPHLGATGTPIILYCDYTVPACKDFFTTTLPQLRPLINAGHATLVVRAFPLTPAGVLAAKAAACAHAQSRFWDYLPVLLSNENITLSAARSAGLNTTTFRNCLESAENILAPDLASAQRDYITTVPTAIVGTGRTTNPTPEQLQRLLAAAGETI